MITLNKSILQLGKIFPAAIILLAATALHAAPAKEKVLIYNMSVSYEKAPAVDTKTEKKGDDGKEGKKVIEDDIDHGNYEYFSYIVPNTLARNLAAQNNFEIQRIQELLPVTETPGSKKFFNEVERISREQKARYIITGNIAVKGKKMEVALQFINITARKMVPFNKESMETGAELKDIIADISKDFKEKAFVINKDAQLDQSESPFLKAYAFFGNFSVGVRGGRFFIKGAFSRQYEDSEYVSPYLSYQALSWLGISASSDYLTADNGNKYVLRKSTMLLWGSAINIDFSYWIFKFFGVQLSTGFGVSYSMIHLADDNNPLNKLQSRKKSIDPFLNLAASFKLFFRPVEIQFGSAYKSVFFRGKSLNLITVFFGLGFRM